jgi:hypothetical protein
MNNKHYFPDVSERRRKLAKILPYLSKDTKDKWFNRTAVVSLIAFILFFLVKFVRHVILGL